jgi:hypothetical protein
MKLIGKTDSVEVLGALAVFAVSGVTDVDEDPETVVSKQFNLT